MTIRLLLADDQPLVRAGIAMLLSNHPELAIVGEADDGAAAVALATRLRPDVVLMDVRMPGKDGIAATRELTADGTSADAPIKVLVLTTFDDDEAVYGSLRAGAHGFLLKHAAPEDLVAAIVRVAAGDAWLDPRVAGKVISALAGSPDPGSAGADRIARLTPREREVMSLIAHGLSNSEISDELVLSEATVRTHVARILMKTGSRDRAQAVTLAFRAGLVRP